MYKGILFDLDHTLLLRNPGVPEMIFSLLGGREECAFSDIERAYAESELWQGNQIWEETRSGIRMSDENYLEALASFYQGFFASHADRKPGLYSILRGEYAWEYALHEGARDLLEQLKGKEVLLGIVSNNRPSVRGALSSLGVGHFFQTIVLSEEVGLYKPDPKILALACRNLGVAPSDCLYVGDHPFDVFCAHSAKMDAAWLSASSHSQLPEFIKPPRYVLKSLRELEDLLPV